MEPTPFLWKKGEEDGGEERKERGEMREEEGGRRKTIDE
jgi:hypothetical protein